MTVMTVVTVVTVVTIVTGVKVVSGQIGNFLHIYVSKTISFNMGRIL